MRLRFTAPLFFTALILATGCEAPAPAQTGNSTPITTATSAINTTVSTAASGKKDYLDSNPDSLQLSPVVVEATDKTRVGDFAEERTVNLPPGFRIKVFATGLEHVRWMEFAPDGTLYATVRGEGRIVRLPDKDNDGEADEVQTFADGMTGVHGITFKDGSVYAATEAELIRLKDTDGDGKADEREVLVNDLPTGGEPGGSHSTRTIAFGPDGKLYVSAGSSCNVCVEDDPKRAAISRYSADGKFEKVYAKGLRNAVGIIFHPDTGELWATNNGRDKLGDDIPPESIYKVKEDADYGWPFCFGTRTPDVTQNPPAGYCEKTGLPAINIQPHSAPLGFAFYTGDQFPEEYKGQMIVALHGSFDRSVPTGYKLIRIRMKDGEVDFSAGDRTVEDFATGWQTPTGHWGRPVLPLVAPDGSLFLTEDATMSIYKIMYQENSGP